MAAIADALSRIAMGLIVAWFSYSLGRRRAATFAEGASDAD